MKIVHALAYYGNYIGGIQRYVEDVARAQRAAGHDVSIVTSAMRSGKAQRDVRTVWTPFSAYRVPFTPFITASILRENPDVLHVHLPLPWLDLNAALVKLVRPSTELVLTIHNRVPAPSVLTRCLAWLHDRVSMPLALRAADRVIVTSGDFASSLRYRIPPRKQRVVPLGVDTHLFAPGKRAPAQGTVLFVGRLVPEKGLAVLMRAMRLVRMRNARAKLTVVTADNYGYDTYAKEIRALDDGFLTIHKDVPHAQMPRFYQEARVTVLPSVELDSFGYTLIESLSCGTPIVTSDLPGPRTVAPAPLALVAKRGDEQALALAIERQLSARPAVRTRARAFAKSRYSASIVTKQVTEAYR